MNTEIATDLIENNILIDVFMGNATEGEITPGSIYAEDIKYHSDWSCLMPVVEKIESLDAMISIRYNYVYLKYHIYKNEQPIDIIEKTKIQAVYEAVVKYVKWHKSQPDFLPSKQ